MKSGLLLLVFLLLLPSFGHAAKISLVGDDWCPYNCSSQEKPGFMVEIARAAYAEAQIEIGYRLIPWRRAKQGVQQGLYDAIVGMSVNHTTRGLYTFPAEPFADSRFCFFKRAEDDWTYTDTFNLPLRQLGVVQGYGYGPDGSAIDNYLKQHQAPVTRVSGQRPQSQLIEMLQKKRIDLTLEDRLVMKMLLAEKGLQGKLVEAGCLADVDQVQIGFSRQNPRAEELAALLSAGLKRLKTSGEYARILSRYTE